MPDHLWLHYSRPRPMWYSLNDSNRTDLKAKWCAVARTSKSAGAHHLGTWSVRGQHDYSLVEVWLFPGPDVILSHWQGLIDAHYTEWFAAANTLGVPTLGGNVLPSPQGRGSDPEATQDDE